MFTLYLTHVSTENIMIGAWICTKHIEKNEYGIFHAVNSARKAIGQATV
jgi:hypothetical protein